MNLHSLMKRRAFIQTAAAALTSAALPSLSHGGEFTGVIRKAIKYTNVAEPKLSIEDKFKLVKELGSLFFTKWTSATLRHSQQGVYYLCCARWRGPVSNG